MFTVQFLSIHCTCGISVPYGLPQIIPWESLYGPLFVVVCGWEKNGTNLILKLSTTLPGVVNTVGTAEPAVRENCNQCIPMHQQGIKIKPVRQEEFSCGGIKGRRSKAVFPIRTFNCGGPPQINHHPPQISFLFLALPIFTPVPGNASDMFFALPLSMPVSIFNMPQHVPPCWHTCCLCDHSHSHSWDVCSQRCSKWTVGQQTASSQQAAWVE